MEKYQFQLASDIHIEKKYPKFCAITDFIVPSAENLILAGDIGSLYYRDQLEYFLESCKKHFETVIFVPGNNEYYIKEGVDPIPFNELNLMLYDMCIKLGIVLLNNSCIETDDLIIFGSTWWSYIPDLLNMRILMKENAFISADEFNYLHTMSKLSLNTVLETKGQKRLLVITHYCPTKLGTMDNHHKSTEFKPLLPYYFSSDERYFRTKQIRTWIFGHTHVFRDFSINDTRILSNADPRKRFFKTDFVFDV